MPRTIKTGDVADYLCGDEVESDEPEGAVMALDWSIQGTQERIHELEAILGILATLIRRGSHDADLLTLIDEVLHEGAQ